MYQKVHYLKSRASIREYKKWQNIKSKNNANPFFPIYYVITKRGDPYTFRSFTLRIERNCCVLIMKLKDENLCIGLIFLDYYKIKFLIECHDKEFNIVCNKSDEITRDMIKRKVIRDMLYTYTAHTEYINPSSVNKETSVYYSSCDLYLTLHNIFISISPLIEEYKTNVRKKLMLLYCLKKIGIYIPKELMCMIFLIEIRRTDFEKSVDVSVDKVNVISQTKKCYHPKWINE